MKKDDELHSSQYWHERAEEIRTKAEEILEPAAKTTMLGIADMYDRMAERAAKREARAKKPMRE